MGKGIDGAKLKQFLARQSGVSSCSCGGMNWTQFWCQVWGRLREWRLSQGQWWPHPPIRYFSSSSPFFCSLLSSCIKIPDGPSFILYIKIWWPLSRLHHSFTISACDHLSSRTHSAVVCLVLMVLLLEIEIRAPQWAFLFVGFFWGLYLQCIFSYERHTSMTLKKGEKSRQETWIFARVIEISVLACWNLWLLVVYFLEIRSTETW